MSYYRLARAGNIYARFMGEKERFTGEEFERVTTEVSGYLRGSRGRGDADAVKRVFLGFCPGFVGERLVLDCEVQGVSLSFPLRSAA